MGEGAIPPSFLESTPGFGKKRLHFSQLMLYSRMRKLLSSASTIYAKENVQVGKR